MSTICDELARVITRHKCPRVAHELCHKRFGQNCSTSSIRHVHDIHGEISVDSCLYEFILHLYEFCDMCTRTTRHSYDMSTSSCEFVRVLHDHSRVYDLVQYITICYDIYTRLVRQRTNLARLSTISNDFYTTSDAF